MKFPTSYERHSIKIDDHKVCAYSLGSGTKTVLIIHGGPGAPSISVQDSHKDLADAGYRIITWDQLGCGNSDKPNDDKLWTLARFIEEAEAVRNYFDISKMHIIGQSWGGILGLEYYFKYPSRVSKFVAVSTGFDMPRIQRGFERRKHNLGSETALMMARREADGTTEHDEYKAVSTLLFHRHVCRLEKIPTPVSIAKDGFSAAPMEKIFGKYFYNCTGELENYSRFTDLHNVDIPTLFLHGEHDYIDPELAYIGKDLIPNAKLRLFRGCSHLLSYEKNIEYINELKSFFYD